MKIPLLDPGGDAEDHFDLVRPGLASDEVDLQTPPSPLDALSSIAAITQT